MSKTVFISYSTRYSYVTTKIHDFLESKLGLDTVFWDKELIPAKDWRQQLENEIQQRDIFLYLLTPESVQSLYCLGEYNLAVKHERMFIPVLLHPDAEKLCPDQINRKQLVDFTKDKEKSEADLIEVIKNIDDSYILSGQMINPVVAGFHRDQIIDGMVNISRNVYLEYLRHRDFEKNLEINKLRQYGTDLELNFSQLKALHNEELERDSDLKRLFEDLKVHIIHIEGYGNPKNNPDDIKESAEKALGILSQLRWQ